MSNKILITDTLFIFNEHVKELEAAGYEVERLSKPEATEDELVEAVKGKVGYILGGIEKITPKVIDAADELKVIVFTGTGYKGFIPGWQEATRKGIAIGNVPDGPTQAVAEWSVMAALAMNRGIFDLASPNGKTFLTTKGLEGLTIGIIGLGQIGGRIAEMVQPFRPAAILYYSTHHHEDKEKSLGLKYMDMNEVLKNSDVVFLCVPDEVGHGFFTAGHFTSMKQDALLVSFMHSNIIDIDALYGAIDMGKIRAISDYPMDERFNKLPLSSWYSFKASNAFNTEQALKFTSDKATKALINLLTTGKDENRVN